MAGSKNKHNLMKMVGSLRSLRHIPLRDKTRIAFSALHVRSRRNSVSGLEQQPPDFDPKSGDVVFVTDELALGQRFCWYLGFPCLSHPSTCSIPFNHPIIDVT
jgi:hypothetical protein